MMEDKSFELMPYFMWKIKYIPSMLKLKSPIFTVADMKFSMLFQQYGGKSELSMVPEVADQQATVPSYTIKTGVSIMNPDKYFEDFLFIQKTTISNSTGSKESHLVWQLETKSLDKPDMVQGENGQKCVTFLCVFGSLSQYQKEEMDFENPWCEFLCMESLGKDLDKLRLNEDASFLLKCGDNTLYVHEVILSARSGKFAAMFRNKTATEKEIEIKDMEFEVLENLIAYIYSGRLKQGKQSVELIMKLYRIAIEYEVEPLKVKASFRLIEILNNTMLSNSAETLEKRLPSSPDKMDKKRLPSPDKMDKKRLPSSPVIMDKKKLSSLSRDFLSMADECKDENFKTEIILSIVHNNSFILKEEEWKEFLFRQENKMLAMEVYDVLVNEV